MRQQPVALVIKRGGRTLPRIVAKAYGAIHRNGDDEQTVSASVR
jgi:hypothetical protein